MRDNGYNADGTPKEDNPLLYPHLHLDAPQSSRLPIDLQSVQLSPSLGTTTTPSHAHATVASGTSPAQLLHAIKVAIRDAIAGGLSFSTILHFIHANFAQSTPDPIIITIDD